jgi:hypothetical protein
VVTRPTFVAVGLGEPERAVGAGDDVSGKGVRGGQRVRLDLAAGRHALDAVEVAVGDPQRAVASGGDAGRAEVELDRGDLALGGDAPQAVEAAVGRPEGAVWAGGDVGGDGELRQRVLLRMLAGEGGRGERDREGGHRRSEDDGGPTEGELHAGDL